MIGKYLTLNKIMYLCWVYLPPIYFLHITEKKERVECARKKRKINVVKISIENQFKIKGFFFFPTRKREHSMETEFYILSISFFL